MMHISIGIPESSVSSAPVSAVFAAVSASIWRRLEISVLDALTAPSLHIEAIVRRSVSTPSLVFALIVTGGALRWYIFIGELIGFFAYYFTIGRVVVACAERVCNLILRLWHGLWWVVFWPFRMIGRLLRRPVAFLGEKFRKMGKKGANFFKKGLKQAASVLYNHRVSKHKRAGSAAVGHTEGNTELR